MRPLVIQQHGTQRNRTPVGELGGVAGALGFKYLGYVSTVPLAVLQADPASTKLPLESILTQSPLVRVPVVVPKVVVLPLMLPQLIAVLLPPPDNRGWPELPAVVGKLKL